MNESDLERVICDGCGRHLREGIPLGVFPGSGWFAACNFASAILDPVIEKIAGESYES